MSRTPWSEQEITYLRSHYHEKDIDLAEALGRSLYSIKNKRKNLRLLKSKQNYTYKINTNFFKIWTNEMTYVLGLIYADGCLLTTKNGRLKSFKISIQEKYHLEKIRNIMKSNYPIKVNEKENEEGEYSLVYEFFVHRKDMMEDLLKLGVTPRKSNTMFVLDIPEKYWSHFLRGYFDGDGSVKLYKGRLRVSYTSGSKEFLQDVQRDLESTSIFSTLKEYEVEKDGKVRIWFELNFVSGSKKQFFSLIYKDCKTLYLERKKLEFEEYFFNYLIVPCQRCDREFTKDNGQRKYCPDCREY